MSKCYFIQRDRIAELSASVDEAQPYLTGDDATPSPIARLMALNAYCVAERFPAPGLCPQAFKNGSDIAHAAEVANCYCNV